MEKCIMIYNDNTGTSGRVNYLLRGEGIELFVVKDRKRLFDLLEEDRMELLLFDLELDGLDWYYGVELLSEIRRQSNIPIIVVSAQKMESAKIMALDAGADDYVTTECNPLELLARIKSQMRRYEQLQRVGSERVQIYKVDGLVVDDKYRSVMVDGREVKLTPIEYEILKLLVKERGRTLSVSQIYESIWNMQAYGADNTVAVHIRHIRKKIEPDPKEPRYLKVVWGTGYKIG
ncbi:MAG: winged helix-turn-helix domain-containing protein [Lachnospiraceae bacterium]|nr:winged helix-turn-helix domain-containing protein [Lachnospiraceae bacterium]